MSKQIRSKSQNFKVEKPNNPEVSPIQISPGQPQSSKNQQIQNVQSINDENFNIASVSNYIEKKNQIPQSHNVISIDEDEKSEKNGGFLIGNFNDEMDNKEGLKLNKQHIELLKRQSNQDQDQKDNTTADQTFQRFQSKSTMQSEELYFVQDVYRTQTTIQDEETTSMKNIEDIEKLEKKKKKKKKNYFITFRWNYFIEYFFYHFLFLAVIGPLTILVLRIKPGIKMLRNLNFWGSSMSFYMQTIQYFMSLQILFCYFYIGFDHYYFYGEYIYVLSGVFFRIISISFKYATYDPLQNSAMHKRLWTMTEKGNELILGQWAGQSLRNQYTEIHFQLRRQEIDESMFYISFMVLPQEEQMEKIYENIIELSEFHEGKVFQPDPIGQDTLIGDIEFVYGYGIIKYLIDVFQKNVAPFKKRTLKFTFIYSLIRISIPFLMRFYEGKKLMGDSYYEGTAIVFTIFLSLFVVMYMLTIGWQGVIDLKRKLFFMDQMTFILSPRKLQDIDSKKYLNSINIFTSLNIKAWMLIRKVMFEYGEKFFLRIQYNIGLLCLLAIGFIPILILASLEIIQTDPAFILLSLSDIMFLIVILLYYMYLGAEINLRFKKHIEILMENKQIIDDFYRNRTVYFPQNTADDLILKRKISKQFKSQNFLYNKGVSFINNHVKTDYIHQYLNDLSFSYKQFILDLKHEEEVYPLKIFNITIRYTVLESIVIGSLSGIGSIAGAIVYNLDSQNDK